MTDVSSYNMKISDQEVMVGQNFYDWFGAIGSLDMPQKLYSKKSESPMRADEIYAAFSPIPVKINDIYSSFDSLDQDSMFFIYDANAIPNLRIVVVFLKQSDPKIVSLPVYDYTIWNSAINIYSAGIL